MIEVHQISMHNSTICYSYINHYSIIISLHSLHDYSIAQPTRSSHHPHSPPPHPHSPSLPIPSSPQSHPSTHLHAFTPYSPATTTSQIRKACSLIHHGGYRLFWQVMWLPLPWKWDCLLPHRLMLPPHHWRMQPHSWDWFPTFPSPFGRVDVLFWRRLQEIYNWRWWVWPCGVNVFP